MISDSSKRSHVLLTLGLLFTIGGAARFLPSSLASADSMASPDANADITHEVSDREAIKTPAKTVSLSGTPAAACFSPETAELMAKDQKMIAAEKKDLEEERLALQAWEVRLQEQTDQLLTLQDTLEARWQEMQATSNEDIQHLSQMYGSMKPDQAAQIFNQMDPGFAAGFLRELSSEQAGLILAGMETSKAYVVSVQLASMNDDIREDGAK